MKRICTLMLIAVVVYFTSCNNDSANPNLLVVPQEDSVSKGSFLQIKFSTNGWDTEYFYIKDLTLNNQVMTSLHASTLLTEPDSLYTAKIKLTDYKSQKISLNLALIDTVRYQLIGNYYIVNNSSTFTDYSKGENKNYAIDTGSVVNITHDGLDCTTGSMMLNLYYNHKITVATGSFKIFH